MDQTKNPGQQGQEPAEGSRENVRGNQPNQNQPDQQGGGVSNRPADREQKEQADVPPRGQNKDERNE